jgi:hypothetical protein
MHPYVGNYSKKSKCLIFYSSYPNNFSFTSKSLDISNHTRNGIILDIPRKWRQVVPSKCWHVCITL